MIATINPNNPIWDQYILNNLDITLKEKTKDNRILEAIKTYENIKSWYKEFIISTVGKNLIRKFDDVLPEYTNVSSIKKIDCFLWQNRE